MNRELADMRENYQRGKLVEQEVHPDAIRQFQDWFLEAQKSDISEPNAMILSTVNKHGVPSSRTVLLKELDHEGFVFYTNYESQKAQDIKGNNRVSLLFLWKEIERQVRISGIAEKVSTERSLAYYHKRPRGSQIGAWTSPQSQVIPNREILESRKEEISKKYAGIEELPLPDFWGGYMVKPLSIEFWQGRTSRLHDRLRYTKDNNNWKIERLAP